MGEFGCSPRFASHCLERPAWGSGVVPDGVDRWMTGEALANGFKLAQAALGPRLLAHARKPPGLPDVFQQVMDAVRVSQLHAGYWLTEGRPKRLRRHPDGRGGTGAAARRRRRRRRSRATWRRCTRCWRRFSATTLAAVTAASRRRGPCRIRTTVGGDRLRVPARYRRAVMTRGT
jgi:hypothetical protein